MDLSAHSSWATRICQNTSSEVHCQCLFCGKLNIHTQFCNPGLVLRLVKPMNYAFCSVNTKKSAYNIISLFGIVKDHHNLSNNWQRECFSFMSFGEYPCIPVSGWCHGALGMPREGAGFLRSPGRTERQRNPVFECLWESRNILFPALLQVPCSTFKEDRGWQHRRFPRLAWAAGSSRPGVLVPSSCRHGHSESESRTLQLGSFQPPLYTLVDSVCFQACPQTNPYTSSPAFSP